MFGQAASSTEKIVDDLLVHSTDLRNHVIDVIHIFELCRQFSVTLSKDKVQFAKDTVDYAGFVISKEGVRADPKKLSAIAQFPRPANLTDLRSFIGLSNQLGAFSSRISELAAPLRDLMLSLIHI